jgi:flagellar hook-basal body complex protein FliE
MSDLIPGIPTMRITPSGSPAAQAGSNGAGGADFGGVLREAVQNAIQTGHDADTQSIKAITQGGNVTEVATALAHAEMTLQTATAVRDRMLQAYQDIMKIQI